VVHGQALIGVETRTVEGIQYDYVTRLRWSEPDVLSAIRVQATLPDGELVVRGLSLVDERTGSFQSLVISSQGRFRLAHSGDVKIYENLDALPIAFVARDVAPVPDDDTALAAMKSPAYDPGSTVVLSQVGGVSGRGEAGRGESYECGTGGPEVRLARREPELIEMAVNLCESAYLVVSSAWYPGWEATVDGRPVAVQRANLFFGAVPLDAGHHEVVYAFQPKSLRIGAAVSVGALGCLILLSVLLLRCPRVRAML
jgi:hypothetical protein